MRSQRLKNARTLFGGVDLAIHIKDVLPGLAVDGAGLDFGEVGADGGEVRERGDERSGTMFDGKGEADLVGLGIGNGVAGAADEEETGEVFRVVLDAGLEDLRAIKVRGRLAGDGGGVAVAQFDQLLDAAGGVVEGEGLHPGVSGKEAPALRQGYRMR